MQLEVGAQTSPAQVSPTGWGCRSGLTHALVHEPSGYARTMVHSPGSPETVVHESAVVGQVALQTPTYHESCRQQPWPSPHVAPVQNARHRLSKQISPSWHEVWTGPSEHGWFAGVSRWSRHWPLAWLKSGVQNFPGSHGGSHAIVSWVGPGLAGADVPASTAADVGGLEASTSETSGLAETRGSLQARVMEPTTNAARLRCMELPFTEGRGDPRSAPVRRARGGRRRSGPLRPRSGAVGSSPTSRHIPPFAAPPR